MQTVRELEKRDIPFIINYWMESEDDYLRGMGVNLAKMPERNEWKEFLEKLVETADQEKPSFCLIWELHGQPIGHCNVSKITYGEKAYMHLHIWNSQHRKQGLAASFLDQSIPTFFEKLELKELFCEPWAENPAPNKALPKAGFELVDTYFGIPGWINFEQEVNVYRYKTTSKISENP